SVDAIAEDLVERAAVEVVVNRPPLRGHEPERVRTEVAPSIRGPRRRRGEVRPVRDVHGPAIAVAGAREERGVGPRPPRAWQEVDKERHADASASEARRDCEMQEV